MKNILISASTNPAEKDLIEYVKKIDNLVDFMHCDVMDGKFVASKCLSSDIVKQINNISTIKLDTHLMVENPQNLIKDYAEAGSNIITVHYEAFKTISQLKRCLEKIKKLKCLCGVSVNPSTSIKEIEPILNKVDLVLVMSVVPGKSGQSFNYEVLPKVKTLSQLRFKYSYKYLIEVDGGINNENCATIINNGADILVSGSYLYNSKDYKQAISALKNSSF